MRHTHHVRLACQLPADEHLDHHAVVRDEFRDRALANLAGAGCGRADDDAGEKGGFWQSDSKQGAWLGDQPGQEHELLSLGFLKLDLDVNWSPEM